jgi:hypothetical protein
MGFRGEPFSGDCFGVRLSGRFSDGNGGSREVGSSLYMAIAVCPGGDEEEVEAWALIDSMGGPGLHDVVFADERVAKLKAQDMWEEWVDYIPQKVRATVLGRVKGIERCEVNGRLFEFDRTSADDEVRSRGLAKLNAEEKRLLGLKGE